MKAKGVVTEFPVLPKVAKDSHGENPTSDVGDSEPYGTHDRM